MKRFLANSLALLALLISSSRSSTILGQSVRQSQNVETESSHYPRFVSSILIFGLFPPYIVHMVCQLRKSPENKPVCPLTIPHLYLCCDGHRANKGPINHTKRPDLDPASGARAFVSPLGGPTLFSYKKTRIITRVGSVH